MKAAARLAPLALTFLLAIAGLLLPGAAGDVSAFVWLGVFPGLALARLLIPGAPASTRWTLGVALSPLAASVAGWALIRAGQPLPLAARMVGLGSWVVFAGGEMRAVSRAERASADAPGDRSAWAWIFASALFVALPVLVNPWIRFRSDTWVHAGIAYEIAERGLPPQDPRFAGLQLNYVWFYNLFIALLDGLRGGSPFTAMAVANVCWMASQVAVGWQLAWTVWRERASARATLPLLLLGLNAGTLLLWPLGLARAFMGQVTGHAEVRRILHGVQLGTVDVVLQLGAPFAHMVNSWDKYTLGTALGYAYLLMLVLLWAAARWLEAGRPGENAEPGAWRWLLVAFAAGAGTMLFHSVVGLSVIPVSLGACACMALGSRVAAGLPPPRRAWALAAALAAGLLVTWPYFHSISAGWSAERSGMEQHFLHLGWRMLWTLATACAVGAIAAWPGVRRAVLEPRPAALWLALWVAGMAAFALVVHLPQSNERKFVWQVFAALAVLGGPGLPGLVAWARRRLGWPLATSLGLVSFVLPSLLFLNGYLRDPAGRTAFETVRRPGERELYAWVRSRTPASAVFTDHKSRDVLLVEGRRRLYVGTVFMPDKAAFPSGEMTHRRAVLADLYGPARDLSPDAASLDSLAAPVYVLYRAEDFPEGAPWLALEADTARFERAYADTLGHRVYRLRPR